MQTKPSYNRLAAAIVSAMVLLFGLWYAPASAQEDKPAKPEATRQQGKDGGKNGGMAKGNLALLELAAKTTETASPINKGLEWKVFGSIPGQDGKLPLVESADGGGITFDLKPGSYIVHVAYGHASAVRKFTLKAGAKREEIVLNCGGLQLNAIAANDTPIEPKYLLFDVYDSQANATSGRRKLLATRIKPGQIIPFPAGTYHVVSRYGKLNAETRADLKVEAGKVTQATLQQRAAKVTFQLVRKKGGDAIADTAWSILTEDGSVISESNSTFPSMVLPEGNYSAIAKNGDTIYSQNFEVESGMNKDVEVIAQSQ